MERKKQRRDEVLQQMVIERIKELRKIHNHTQEYVIENTRVDVSHIETGENYPSLTSLSTLCAFYKITLDEFFAPLNYPPKE